MHVAYDALFRGSSDCFRASLVSACSELDCAGAVQVKHDKRRHANCASFFVNCRPTTRKNTLWHSGSSGIVSSDFLLSAKTLKTLTELSVRWCVVLVPNELQVNRQSLCVRYVLSLTKVVRVYNWLEVSFCQPERQKLVHHDCQRTIQLSSYWPWWLRNGATKNLCLVHWLAAELRPVWSKLGKTGKLSFMFHVPGMITDVDPYKMPTGHPGHKT